MGKNSEVGGWQMKRLGTEGVKINKLSVYLPVDYSSVVLLFDKIATKRDPNVL